MIWIVALLCALALSSEMGRLWALMETTAEAAVHAQRAIASTMASEATLVWGVMMVRQKGRARDELRRHGRCVVQGASPASVRPQYTFTVTAIRQADHHTVVVAVTGMPDIQGTCTISDGFLS